MIKTLTILGLILCVAGCAELTTSDLADVLKETPIPQTELPVEVWIGTVLEVDKTGFGQPNVMASITISPAELTTPEADLSAVAKCILDQQKRVPGKTNLFERLWIGFDEPEEFPDGQLPSVGEKWEFSCTTGKEGHKWLVSGRKKN